MQPLDAPEYSEKNRCSGYNNCQAQFQFSTSQVELSLALSLIITTPTHPPTHPPGKVEIQLKIDHKWPVDR